MYVNRPIKNVLCVISVRISRHLGAVADAGSFQQRREAEQRARRGIDYHVGRGRDSLSRLYANIRERFVLLLQVRIGPEGLGKGRGANASTCRCWLHLAICLSIGNIWPTGKFNRTKMANKRTNAPSARLPWRATTI
jgi:hypothetical protein